MFRIKTEIFVKAWLQRCLSAGAFAVIVRKGNPEAGILIVKVVTGDGTAKAFIETFTPDGETGWRALRDEFVDEHEIDVLINKETGFDPDLWVVEVQDKSGRSFLENVD